MGLLRSLVVPGRQRSSPHTCLLIWSGGARTIMDVASSSIAANEARAATRTRGQIIGATRPPAHSSHGSRQNPPAMDGPRGARLPFVANFRLRATEARWGTVSGHGE